MDAPLFNLSGSVTLVTGGSGALGSVMAKGLAKAGARVGVLGRREEAAQEVAEAIRAAGGEALPLSADVLEKDELLAARDALLKTWGRLDILVNAAGGNLPEATATPERDFFGLEQEALEQVLRLNLLGTILPSQVFGAVMTKRGKGSIVNISSMAAQKPLTRVVGYGAAKAGLENFTRWLAVDLAQKHGPGLRVNALAPGFFVGEQNRALLLNDDGTLTERGQRILEHTPMGRFGDPEDLVGALLWLASDASSFVTGVVVPVDGGFSAFGGV